MHMNYHGLIKYEFTFIISSTIVEPCTSICFVLLLVGDVSCNVCGMESLGSLQPVIIDIINMGSITQYLNIPSGLCSSLSGKDNLDERDRVVAPADMLRLMNGSSKL